MEIISQNNFFTVEWANKSTIKCTHLKIFLSFDSCLKFKFELKTMEIFFYHLIELHPPPENNTQILLYKL